jgi:hypothetical protein
MRKLRVIAATAVAAAGVVFAGAEPIAAQVETSRISLEGRVGVAIPTGDLSDADAGAGLALGADFMYTFAPTLTGYLGISRHMFSCDGCDEITAGGFQVGLKFLLARQGGALPWLRGGLLGQTLDTGSTSDLGLGFEAGAGLDIPVTHRFSVAPALNYRMFSPGGTGFDDFSANWIAITLGGHLHF